MAIENIHSGRAPVTLSAQSISCACGYSNICAFAAEMYSLLLETYIKDPQEKSRLFHAIDTIPAVTRKAEWAMKWIQRYAVTAAQPIGQCVPPNVPAAVRSVACAPGHFSSDKLCCAVRTALLSALWHLQQWRASSSLGGMLSVCLVLLSCGA